MKYVLVALWGLIAMSFVSATALHAQSDYRLKAGDTVSVEVLEDPQLNRSLLVLPDGSVSFPFVGSLQAGGRTVGQLESAIRSGIASNFAAPPNVFVSVNALRPREPRAPSQPKAPETIAIYLLGEVSSPGLKEVKPGTTFLQAMSQAGAFTNFAAKKRIQLRRTSSTGHQTLYKINYKALANGAALSDNLVLQEGDVILVPERRLFE